MGDRTMPPPRGPVNPRKKFAVKQGFSMLVGQRANLPIFVFAFSSDSPQALSFLKLCLFLEVKYVLTDGNYKTRIIVAKGDLDAP